MTSSTAAQIEKRCARLEHYWSEYESVQTKIELQDEDESGNRECFKEAFYTLTARIRELLNSMNDQYRAPTPSPANPRAPNALDSSTQIRLPKLNLPSFSGNYDE